MTWSIYRDGHVNSLSVAKGDAEWRQGWKRVATFSTKVAAMSNKKLLKLDTEIADIEKCLREPSTLALCEIAQLEAELKKLTKSWRKAYNKCLSVQ